MSRKYNPHVLDPEVRLIEESVRSPSCPVALRRTPRPIRRRGVSTGVPRKVRCPRSTVTSVVRMSAPTEPSTVFRGLVFGASLRRPSVFPITYAKTSFN